MAWLEVAIRSEPLDTVQIQDRLREAAPEAGAIVTFTGLCRSEGGRLEALELEHYPGMAEAEIRKIAEEAADRWPIEAAVVVHRHGRVPAGETIVFVGTASPHRGAAFSAANYLMDFLKTRAPFWKKEHPVDGKPTDWVEAHDRDDAALEKWHQDK